MLRNGNNQIIICWRIARTTNSEVVGLLKALTRERWPKDILGIHEPEKEKEEYTVTVMPLR